MLVFSRGGSIVKSYLPCAEVLVHDSAKVSRNWLNFVAINSTNISVNSYRVMQYFSCSNFQCIQTELPFNIN